MGGRIFFCGILLILVGAWAAAEPPDASGREEGERAHPMTSSVTSRRRMLYHLAEGSEIFPRDWLMALKSVKTGRPFLEESKDMHSALSALSGSPSRSLGPRSSSRKKSLSLASNARSPLGTTAMRTFFVSSPSFGSVSSLVGSGSCGRLSFTPASGCSTSKYHSRICISRVSDWYTSAALIF